MGQVTGYYLRFHHAPPKTLISDGEGAVAAYEEEFNSVGGQVHFVARNQHVALAECYIGKLKTIMRTILASIPFKWPTCFFSYLVEKKQVGHLKGKEARMVLIIVVNLPM